MKKVNNIRVRAALSPTGNPHLGTIRTALFNYLFARSQNGMFFIRIDDTDAERTVEGSREKILKSIRDFGMQWDDIPVIQSKRLPLYENAAKQLIRAGNAYNCFCSPLRLDKLREDQKRRGKATKYDRRCVRLSPEEVAKKIARREKSVIRLRVPQRDIVTYDDYLRGAVSVSTKNIDDQILIKTDRYPTYHLATVVDDNDMNITHVIRADEWLASTPKHVLLFQAFHWRVPIFVHVPLIVNTLKKKLSKRDGDFDIQSFVQEGYVLPALLNYAALLGWRPKEAEKNEFFSLSEMVKLFSLDDLQKSPAVFSQSKLQWFNSSYIKNKDSKSLLMDVKKFLTKNVEKRIIERFLEVERERLVTLKDIDEFITPFTEHMPPYDVTALQWKDMSPRDVKKNLMWVYDVIAGLDERVWNVKTLEMNLRNSIESQGMSIGEVLWPLRVALSGLKRGPSPFACIYILGKAKSLFRLKEAERKVGNK